MTEHREEYHVRMVKADPVEVETLREFMDTLGEMVDYEAYPAVIGQWVCDNFPQWERVVLGYSVLVESACDPELSYLDWKPDLKRLIEAYSTTGAAGESEGM